MKLHEDITLVFKNDAGLTKELTITALQLIDKTLEDLYEMLEDDCNCSSCNNESQNFCDCGAEYEDYELYEILID